MKNHFITFLIKYKIIAVAILYIGCSIVLGEIHPFSRFPMYNSFPNWSYAFYLADKDGKLIPSKEFKTTGGKMGHTFYSICEARKINYGYAVETEAELQSIGKEMLDLILANNNHSKEFPYLALHRLHYFYQNDTIKQTNTIIYERSLE